MSANLTITGTGTGTTDSVYLQPGQWVIAMVSGTWGSATLQASADGKTTFVDVEDSSGVITATANKLVLVGGGVYVRMNVASYSADIVLTAQRSSD